MDELAIHALIIIGLFIVITLGGHLIFALAWGAAIIIAISVITLLYLGFWAADLTD